MRGVVVSCVAVTALFALSGASGVHARWIDAQTGEAVRRAPAGTEVLDPDPVLARDRKTGRYFAWDEQCGTWIDAQTGEEVRRAPAGTEVLDPDPMLARDRRTGRYFAWEPCPPPPALLIPGTGDARQQVGFYFGGQLLWNAGRVRANEYLAATGALTNSFLDTGDALGAGLVTGFNVAPWGNGIVVGGFASLNVLNQTINRSFAGGTFLGTTTHWIATAGVKAGVVTGPGVFLYGLAGASVLNADLVINFGGPVSTANRTVWGTTLGIGAAFQPAMLQHAGRPVSLFVQYQHTWWDTARLNQPAASPAFNYSFRREDDTLRVGVIVHFGATAAPAAPVRPGAMIAK